MKKILIIILSIILSVFCLLIINKENISVDNKEAKIENVSFTEGYWTINIIHNNDKKIFEETLFDCKINDYECYKIVEKNQHYQDLKNSKEFNFVSEASWIKDKKLAIFEDENGNQYYAIIHSYSNTDKSLNNYIIVSNDTYNTIINNWENNNKNVVCNL